MSQVAPPSSQRRSTLKRRSPSHLTPRERLFVESYVGDAALDAVKAATATGAADPKSLAWKMMRRPRVRNAISRRIGKRVASKQELLGELSEVATAPWRDFVTLQYGSDGTEVVGATINLGDKLKAADLLLKAQGAYIDPLTRALGQLAMIEVNRMLAAKRKAAKAARIERLSKRNQRLLGPGGEGAPPPVVDEVEAEVVPPPAQDAHGKARQDD